MMRSLFAGVQGLRAHQVRMDVIGNNIANVNTVAFKGARVNFSDMYSQTLSASARPGTTVGGVNPKQVGLGVDIGSIDTIQTQGSTQLTGKVTDMAINGNGLFVMREGGRFVYTRAGTFDFDANGYLVNPSTGQRVQGWLPSSAGVFPSRDASTMTDLKVSWSDTQLAKATSTVTFDQALNAASAIGTTHTVGAKIIDSLGEEHSITLTFTKMANNAWNITGTDPAGAALALSNPYAAGDTVAPAVAAGTSRIQFTSTGALMDYDTPAVPNPTTPWQLTTSFTPPGGAAAQTVKLDFSGVVQPVLTGDDTTSSLRAVSSDGYTAGTLAAVNVDLRGVVTGRYTNGNFQEIGQVAMAAFANPGGLIKEAGNNWAESVNSGMALIGAAGEGGRGTVTANSLEMSNVDLSAEFTNMIVTQRGFQANSRIVTTTDEMLQELVNLKR